MCGIVGYIGNRDGSEVVLAGLRGLEYRGYDSAGIAILDKDNKPKLLRQVGRVNGLERLVEEAAVVNTPAAIGHTRWATHGKPSVLNAHPHANTDETIFVVHNGIIENYMELRKFLQAQGYEFKSDTDTEVLPQLIDYYFKKDGSFEEAFVKTLAEVRGAYAILAMSAAEPDKLYAARLSSPMVIGVGKDECIVASDPSAILAHTKEVIYVHDNEMVVVTRGEYKITDLKNDVTVKRETEHLDFDVNESELGDYPHFMLKEIFEAPQTIRLATLGRTNAETGTVKLGGLESVRGQLEYIDRILIVSCGTSYYASLVGEYLIEEIAGIPVEVQLASEFKYRNEPFSRSTAILAVSQSGETADTIAALKKVEDYGVLRLGIVNAVGSTIARMTDAGVYCHAGPELAVASTKAFIAQVTVLLQIALNLAKERNQLYKPLLEEIEALPAKAEAILKQADTIKALAEKYKDYRDFLFIGRRYSYPGALEGALKLKEVSYIHAEGYAAGEMKHGPLAMIDENFPTFALATESPLLEKTCSNIQEIKARSGKVVAVATEGDTLVTKHADDVIYVPKTLEQTSPILEAIVMQLFSYYVAVAKGFNVDRPRNLAKSVTVE
ncbi:MAG TPA: glutamine--fructose-6-phosphate transaminase (isomerizing) [Candidatus Saccharimonadales bacterium]|nr:glutamine--fructose-6-phosphate transaminase (isomerizing) [Candidatus Saccharimonadales bacterium]